MAESGQSFVEWKEEFVSKERGKRVVHYFLKEKSGESVLAVVGTERSVRHMFYVVAEEFLRVNELNRSVNAAYRWRSRREVVNWLTSMLSKQYRQDSPKGDHVSGFNTVYQNRPARNLKLRTPDIVWSGATWTCGKQLKHFPAFCRNGITIAVQSFVFVMAEEGKRHLAFLEDMYEDRKGQKKVKVRWFHHNLEVKGVIILRNTHHKEVFVTPYTQVISVECVDGPAIVLTREHYEKCVSNLPEDLLTRVFLCFRQFKNNRVKPFKLSKLRGYFDQPIFSFLDRGYIEDDEDCLGDNAELGLKRYSRVISYEILRKKLIPKYAKNRQWDIPCFKANEKVELLCQDSGIRGCWFRCTVLRVARRRIKVRYDDLIDEDGSSNLEEWVSAFRLAIPDELGLRHSGRPTMRPAVTQDETDVGFEVGSAVDAWWSDGWWEGVVTEINASENADIQVYIPGETLFLKVHVRDVRFSRDWVGDRWVNVKGNPNARLLISDVALKEGRRNEIYADDVRMEVV
ncbi:uncharacterized protein LOC112500076 [Cynara cardunculus var. scolymus]|uniref:Agenet-like domain-containing protein n=1 Tax=Cynara cardunculus var. scolymus TaxID=59895 RepID=A0A118K161_CYNCS|nr:uncharacterized protein LOC112500076 [Cynara cardunculus var. scolymus]KVI02338.1 Agenet-like domain-containing protein [Cynara cardunculus var. scolymus]